MGLVGGSVPVVVTVPDEVLAVVPAQALRVLAAPGAAAAVPDLAASTLRQGYGVAFQQLTLVLAGLTLLSALVIFVLLRQREGEA